ncbi:hypothetical protein H072_2376 [Dactylellina haptotyla CBS 200.50]|uniref:Alpha/beta hydrolase fold-3 domain-containing protein n=1 Tax=Dactylellina haptotyla (strain CBS 200.50) TaxID=1284197 RepID=S8C7A1_DACHA|nr:hypothetical protein H072_2376 [Dactylellina haptotyla CBS 200.50]
MSFQPAPAECAPSVHSELSKPAAESYNSGVAEGEGYDQKRTRKHRSRLSSRLSAFSLKRKAKRSHSSTLSAAVAVAAATKDGEPYEKEEGDINPPRQPLDKRLRKSKSSLLTFLEREKYPKLDEPDRPISVDNPSIFACFMETSPTAMIRALVPRLPLMGKTVAWHALGISTTAPYWDLKTELLITMIRSFVSMPTPDPLSKAQHVSLKDPGIKGRMWISKVPVPAPTGPETRQYVIDAIDSLIEGDKFDWLKPELPEASAEWTGYRANVAKDAPQLDISEEEKYKKMMEEVSSPVTVYYIHGGAMYLMDPATHRPATARLAKETKGRVLSFRYRLAPQNPFPAALMDCLLGYLYLLYPPPGALHEAVEPKNIVICGDSAGGNLTTALIALLLTLRRMYPDGIAHNGKSVELPLPAGIGLNSPWVDTTHCFPSVITNKDFDYIPSPSIYPPGGPHFPKCAIWPTEPPRKAIYVEDRLRLHPLVNPMLFKDWEGAPPTLILCGQELLMDECRFFGKHLAGQGVTVQFEEYQAMPHCFAMLMDWSPVAAKCYGTWTKFITDVVEGNPVTTKATRTLAKSLKEEEWKWDDLSPYSYEECLERMKGAVEHGNMFHKMGAQAKL